MANNYILPGTTGQLSPVCPYPAQKWYVQPEWFGATGDGVHDDWQAFTTAMSMGPALALTPGKTYYLSQMVSVENPVRILGNSSTVINNGFYITSNDVIVDGVEFKQINENAVECDDSSNITVNDCRFIDVGGCGTLFRPLNTVCSGIKVTNCYFENCSSVNPDAWDVYFNSGDVYYIEDSLVDSCIHKDCGHGCIFPNGENNVVTNCVFDGVGKVTAGNANGVWVHDSKGTSITNCIFKDSPGYYLRILKARDVVVSNCYFTDGPGNAAIAMLYDPSETGRYTGEDGNRGVVITGCMINSVTTGILIDGYSDVNVENTMIKNGNLGVTLRSVAHQASGIILKNIKVANQSLWNIQDWGAVVYADGVTQGNTPLKNTFTALNGTTAEISAPEWASACEVMTNFGSFEFEAGQTTTRLISRVYAENNFATIDTYSAAITPSTINITTVGGVNISSAGVVAHTPTTITMYGIIYR